MSTWDLVGSGVARHAPPKQAERPPAWWVGKSREALNAEAAARAEDMSRSKQAKGIGLGDVGYEALHARRRREAEEA